MPGPAPYSPLPVPTLPLWQAWQVTVISPQGPVVEQYEGDPLERAIAEALHREPTQTLLRDLVDAIDAAADDDRIRALYLDLGGLDGAGIVKLDKMTGKTVWTAKELSDRAGYASIIPADIGGVRTYMTFNETAGVGVRASDGLLLFRDTGAANTVASFSSPGYSNAKNTSCTTSRCCSAPTGTSRGSIARCVCRGARSRGASHRVTSTPSSTRGSASSA
jgi:hypothetical protein